MYLTAALEPLPGMQAELAQLVNAETAKWADVIRRSGERVDWGNAELPTEGLHACFETNLRDDPQKHQTRPA